MGKIWSIRHPASLGAFGHATMADRIIIAFGADVLILTEQEFAQARQRGQALIVAPPGGTQTTVAKRSELVTARKLALELSLPKSCIYQYAKAGRIPSVRIGKHVRFDSAAVLAALQATGAVAGGRS